MEAISLNIRLSAFYIQEDNNNFMKGGVGHVDYRHFVDHSWCDWNFDGHDDVWRHWYCVYYWCIGSFVVWHRFFVVQKKSEIRMSPSIKGLIVYH